MLGAEDNTLPTVPTSLEPTRGTAVTFVEELRDEVTRGDVLAQLPGVVQDADAIHARCQWTTVQLAWSLCLHVAVHDVAGQDAKGVAVGCDRQR